jgi:Nucleotidyl transferase AbiEii toxin, Type IV TA system
MNKVARLTAAKRAELFAETASRRGIAEALIEKDFWACWMLQQLFSDRTLAGRLLFKGGTSLSKVFNAIERFSEDLDIAIDYEMLGFTGSRDPLQSGLSITKRNKILAEMLKECQAFIAGSFLTNLRQRCTAILGPAGDWDLALDEHDPHTICFRYPPSTTQPVAYIAPQVVLELGTHAEFIPRGTFPVRSFAAEEFPGLFAKPDVEVSSILAKRTFWEKATILHAEFHRPTEKPMPPRYSRHYYDLAKLASGSVKAEALADLKLLQQVVVHKQTFFPAAWPRYELAVPGSLRLAPPAERIGDLQRDYSRMGVMMFGEPPTFAQVLAILDALEHEINGL